MRPELTAGPMERSSSPVKVSGFIRLSRPACAAAFAGAAGRARAGGAGLLRASAAVTGRAARVASTSNAARVRLIVLSHLSIGG